MKNLFELEKIGKEERPSKSHQTEFILPVPVCAWCKPHDGSDNEALTHGICPRHLREIVREMQGVATQTTVMSAAAPRSQRLRQIELPVLAKLS